MKKAFLMAVASLILRGGATAQINESDTAQFQMRVSLNGNYQKGNVEILTIRSKLDFLYSLKNDWVFKSQNNSLYQAFYDKKADNDVFSRNYLYFKPHNKFYPFGIGYISSNFRRKIDWRYFVGAGGTWQVINTKNQVIKLSLSAVYEQTQFKENLYNYAEYNGNNQINTWRGTVYLAGWAYVLEKRCRFYYDAFWQPAFNNAHNYRTQFDLGFDLPLYKGLSLNALYTFTHENVVIQKIKNNDKILTFGLSYYFKINHSN